MTRPQFLLILALGTAPAARAGEAPPAPGPLLPIVIGVDVPPSTRAERHHGVPGALAPIDSSTEVAVGEQTHATYLDAVRRLARVDPGAEARLAVELRTYGLELDGRGWFAYVEHELVLRDPAGVVARWSLRGEDKVEGLGEIAVPRAFLRAAEYAAMTFEAAFVSEPAVVAWLARRGVAVDPGLAAALKAPPRLGPRVAPPVAERGARLRYAELGASLVRSRDSLGGGPSLRAGWTGERVIFQLAVDTWGGKFVAYPAEAWGSADGRLRAYALGVEAGAWARLGSRLEVQAGAGPQVLLGAASASFLPLGDPIHAAHKSATATALAGSAFLALRANGVVPWTAVRYRAGVEVRGRLSGHLSFGALGRSLPGPDLSAGLFLGLELPRRAVSTGG